MYNKIASIVMNSGKSAGVVTVFISQPDALIEGAAGKIFVLAEVSGKKSDGEKIINFLISELEENYYQDEKISLIGKIESLKVENIFEAALAKTNKNLNEFLLENKLNFNPAYTNITLGVVHQNRLHFATFGKNRSLLVYRRQDGFEIINVETSAKNETEKEAPIKERIIPPKNTALFSSIVSGEIPLGSYFIFASESLPEYLSGREMVEIITKLPPIVAAEQIKNVLNKINSYVPFLGIIIKNTTDSFGREIKEAIDIPASAQKSISSLNYTEQKTENMLAPAGIVSFSKTIKITRTFFSNLLRGKSKTPRLKKEEISVSLGGEVRINKNDDYPNALNARKGGAVINVTPLNLNESEISRAPSNLPSSSSFMRSEKIIFKRGPKKIINLIKGFVHFIALVFSQSFWRGLFNQARGFFRNLNKLSMTLLVVFVAGMVILSFSLVRSNIKENRQEAIEKFNLLVEEIEKKEVLIDSHLIYDDEVGARRVLNDARDLIENLPREKKYQMEAYDRLVAQIIVLEEKVQKIVRVDNLEILRNTGDARLNNLVFANNKLYGSKGEEIYSLSLNDSAPEIINAPGLDDVSGVKYDDKDTIFYRSDNKIFRLNTKNNNLISNDLGSYNNEDDYQGFSLYGERIYLLARNQNQLYVYPYNNLGSRTSWFKEEVDLTNTTDLYIDGRIYFLNNNGEVSKYFMGKKENYNSIAIEPSTNSANKILGDSKNLYILDAQNKRLVMLAKDTGTLMSQYLLPIDGEIKDFTLDVSGRKLYFLSDNNIYEFAL